MKSNLKTKSELVSDGNGPSLAIREFPLPENDKTFK